MIAPSSSDAGTPDTFPKLLLEHARLRGQHTSIREKDLGIWQSWNWSQVAAEVRALACGLAAMGFKRGDNLAIIGDNRPRLYWAMSAAQPTGLKLRSGGFWRFIAALRRRSPHSPSSWRPARRAGTVFRKNRHECLERPSERDSFNHVQSWLDAKHLANRNPSP